MQKSGPRSDAQFAAFGSNTRQTPPGFQKVASESRPGEFSYQDSASGQKYQTKEIAWQSHYAPILQSEQAQQLLREQSLRSTPSPEALPMTKASDLSSDFYPCAHVAFQPANAATPAHHQVS